MNDQQLELHPQVQAVLSDVHSLTEFSAAFKVSNAEQFVAGADDLKRIKAAQKKLEETRTSMTGPLNQSIKRINEFFRAPTDRLLAIERHIKGKLLAYSQEQERRRAEQQRKLDEEAAKEKRRLEAIAARAADKGQEAKAEQFQERALSTVAPVLGVQTPKVSGLSTRDNWVFTVLDVDKLDRKYLCADEKKIAGLVRSMKADAQAILGEGVRVENKPLLASGAGL